MPSSSELSPQFIRPSIINIEEDGDFHIVYKRPLPENPDPKTIRARRTLGSVHYHQGEFKAVDLGCHFLQGQSGRRLLAPDTQANFVPNRDPQIGLIFNLPTKDLHTLPPYPTYYYKHSKDRQKRDKFNTNPLFQPSWDSKPRPEMLVWAEYDNEVFTLIQQHEPSKLQKVVNAPVSLIKPDIKPGVYYDQWDPELVMELAKQTGVSITYEGYLQGFLNALNHANIGPAWHTFTPKDYTKHSYELMKHVEEIDFDPYSEDYYFAHQQLDNKLHKKTNERSSSRDWIVSQDY